MCVPKVSTSVLSACLRSSTRTPLYKNITPLYPHLRPSGARKFTASSRFLSQKYFSEDHEYLAPTGAPNTYKLGITKYAAKSLGDVTFVELPETDVEVSAGDAVGAVESVKAAADVLIPVDAVVISVNSALEDTPRLISDDAEGEGWIAEVQVKGEVTGLMSEAEYNKFLEEQDESKE